MSRPVIAVAIPSHEMCPSTFAFDLATMLAYSTAMIGDKVEFVIRTVTGTYIHKARTQLLEQIMEEGLADYILWIDSDMRFPKDALICLLDRRVDAVGINYSTRGLPPRFVAISKMSDIDEEGNLIAGANCPTWEESEGLERVDAVGFGFFLMKTKIVEGLPTDRPPFFYEWRAEGLHIGEDVWFCRLVRENGFDIFVDHDLSKRCAHTGSFEFFLEHAQDQMLLKMQEGEEKDGSNDI